MNRTSVTLAERVGVSTLFMPDNGETFLEAVDRAYDAGWRTLEIVPAVCTGHTGYPKTRWAVGFDLDNLSRAERDRIARSAGRFPLRDVHSMNVDVNIASRNPGIRRESIRQFLQCAELARDIGAGIVTFHIGTPSPADAIGDEDFVIERNVDFGKRIADFCEKHDLSAGYENLGGFPTVEQMARIIDAVASPRFGVHLDVGHAWLVGPTDPLDWINALGDRIVNIHMHGTYHRPDRGFENHQSLSLDDCTDIRALMRALAAKNYQGPFILEIISRNIDAYLEMAAESRDILVDAARAATA